MSAHQFMMEAGDSGRLRYPGAAGPEELAAPAFLAVSD